MISTHDISFPLATTENGRLSAVFHGMIWPGLSWLVGFTMKKIYTVCMYLVTVKPDWRNSKLSNINVWCVDLQIVLMKNSDGVMMVTGFCPDRVMMVTGYCSDRVMMVTGYWPVVSAESGQ